MHDILSDIMAESLKNKAKPENKKNLEFLQKEGGFSLAFCGKSCYLV